MILSTTVIVHASVESTDVLCPHNGTHDLCIFTIFSKTDFVDIVPLCCKPLISTHASQYLCSAQQHADKKYKNPYSQSKFALGGVCLFEQSRQLKHRNFALLAADGEVLSTTVGRRQRTHADTTQDV